MDGYPLAALPALTLHPSVDPDTLDAASFAETWLDGLRQALSDISSSAAAAADLAQLFVPECWWRDVNGLCWGIAARGGYDSIAEFLSSSSSSPSGSGPSRGHLADLATCKSGALQPSLVNLPGFACLQFGFTFTNPSRGRGIGFARLVNVGGENNNAWKGWCVFTKLESLLPPPTTPPTAPSRPGGGHYDAQVLVVGAGQSGLAIAARLLREHGIRAVVLDRADRVGAAWRERYQSVRLHTARYCDVMPYVDYPDGYSLWPRGDEVADFLEGYQREMGIEVRGGTTVVGVRFDEGAQTYFVDTEMKKGDGGGETERRTLTSRHLVMATGIFGDEPIMPAFPGRESFKGTAYHSTAHKSASLVPDLASKKVVVVGGATSAHDMAQDFVERGAADVSMVQRGPIFSISSAAMEQVLLSVWNMPGAVSCEEADIIGGSLPVPVMRAMSVGATQVMNAMDADMLERLRKAGFALEDPATAGYGLLDPQAIRGGGFYIDQGACGMIADGRIKIIRCEGGVTAMNEDGLELADGSRVPADIVVFATGIKPAATLIRKVVGDELSGRLGDDFGTVAQDQERVGWWCPTKIPGFWYMTGSLMMVRQYSLTLALNIAAVENGSAPYS